MDGSERIVRSLLESERRAEIAPRILCNHQDSSRNTALHYAVEAGYEGIVRHLVRAGAAATIPGEVSLLSIALYIVKNDLFYD